MEIFLSFNHRVNSSSVKKLYIYYDFKEPSYWKLVIENIRKSSNSRLLMKWKLPKKPVALDGGPCVWSSKISVDLEL